MTKTKINLTLPSIESKSTPIWIGSGINLKELIEFDKYSKVFVITDSNLAVLAEKLFDNINLKTKIIITEPGEDNKDLNSVAKLWTNLQEQKCDRNSLVINFGGGLVCDLGGFAASTFMRGIHFIQIPTTLLSQVDASVGGKVGINHAELKNLVGAFNQPELVICDTSHLSSLSKREFNSGMAEVIKHGLIRSSKYFEFVRNLENIDKNSLTQIVFGSVEIKADVVMKDVKESGIRKVLNFGHTIGHAIESISHGTATPYLHGEAIALGMLVEAKISELSGSLSTFEFEVIKEMLQKYDLPLKLFKNFPASEIFTKIISDKKNANGIINWTLLNKIGQAEFDQHVEPIIVVQAVETII